MANLFINLPKPCHWQLCTDALRAMLAGDERAAGREAAKCRDLATVAFLSVLEQMLQHNMPSTHALDEQHARSLDRLLNQPGRHTALYNDLGVTGGATRADIRAAFRKGALTWHPDVNAAPEAPARFARLAEAYEVLYDEELRRSYDREGPRGVEAAGAIPVGSVVQYALSPAVLALEEGHRSSGIGLLVGRNMDRGDASRLPPERLGLCEVEAFRQTEAGSSCWCPDDLASPAFCHLDDLRPIPVAAYDARFDRWTIEEVLPDGCAGPDLPEEIIL
ncbi:DnaJ-like protein subfamily C member 10 [Auxenochlorella protothecoides]|uniref:DnaJ-like protein subfamily C member 10 n=1 Tax=Auxenochlorella protothecoides TaxID=3075 RepID=A0A087SMA0_AUXPR|nr:DnaJ-like protein subfamily C member 10 [Auxenochlorella protothecoides]KFM26854.1 DnaJ-like protein subfamily C member 10 [Auxenochlorella protothecoides]RMZ52894.1 hypothetical protein APUTEX25_001013 [Auxenochlorella protothecoides]|eukprot:RMZ52894.1 hypothetical protein APUTEX25_001013 [Auxenochlorella protothecoides]